MPIFSRTDSNSALNKIKWDEKGRRSATGTVDGTVYIHDIGQLSNPREDEMDYIRKSLDAFEDAMSD
jgi:dynein intermediate chain